MIMFAASVSMKEGSIISINHTPNLFFKCKKKKMVDGQTIDLLFIQKLKD
jgi:hypothetical protein